MTLNTKTFNQRFYFKNRWQENGTNFLEENKDLMTLEAQLGPSFENLEQDQI